MAVLIGARSGPRTCLAAAVSLEGKRAEFKRRSEEIQVCPPPLRSDVPHLKKIFARLNICHAEEQSATPICCDFFRGAPRTELFAVASSSSVAKVLAMKRPKIDRVTFAFDIIWHAPENPDLTRNIFILLVPV